MRLRQTALDHYSALRFSDEKRSSAQALGYSAVTRQSGG